MKIKNPEYIFLALILIFGFLLRIYQLQTTPFWIDESISSLASKNILEKGLPLFDSGFFYGRALFFHYTQALSMFIFGISDFSSRFPSVIFGLATIFLAFLIGKEYNKTTGLLSALFISIFFIEIAFSRQARFYQLFQFLFFLTLYSLYKSKNSLKYSILASLSFLLLFDTHTSGILLAPFLLFFFIKEKKPLYFLIIPSIILIKYGLSTLGIFTNDSSSIQLYSENYSDTLFFFLRAFFIISLPGIYFSYKYNPKMTLLISIPSLILFFGVISSQTFALRYVYFSIFPILIFFSSFLSEIKKYSKALFIFAIIFSIIYPSNLFFEEPLTIIKPEIIELKSFSEPSLDYKSLNYETLDSIKNSTLVCFFSPACEWYLKKPDYVIPFSLNGLNSGYMIYNNTDSYTGAPLFNYNQNNLILIEDRFSISKLNNSEQMNYLEFKQNCIEIDKTSSIKVLSC